MPTQRAAPRVEDLRARLRGYALPVGGSREVLLYRLGRLEALRARWGADPAALEGLTVPQLKALLEEMDVKAWKLGTKPWLLHAAQRLAAQPEPGPLLAVGAPSRRWAVTWVNPATLEREVYRGGLPRAAADRVRSAAEARLARALVDARFLPEFADGGAFRGIDGTVRVEEEPARAFDPPGTAAEGDAADALRDVARADDAAMGPALSGDRAGLRAAERLMEGATARLEAARRRVWEERGSVDPRGFEPGRRPNPARPNPPAPYATPRPRDVPAVPIFRQLVKEWDRATDGVACTLVSLHAHGCEYVSRRVHEWLVGTLGDAYEGDVIEGYWKGDPDRAHAWIELKAGGRWWILDPTANQFSDETGDPRPLVILPIRGGRAEAYRYEPDGDAG